MKAYRCLIEYGAALYKNHPQNYGWLFDDYMQTNDYYGYIVLLHSSRVQG